MSDASDTAPTDAEPPRANGRHSVGRLGRLVLKELREILRDRRTIITLVVMPILIYPLLALVFQHFLTTSLSVEDRVDFFIGVESPRAMRILDRQLRAGNAELQRRLATEPASDDDKLPGEGVFIHWAVLEPESLQRRITDSSFHLAAIARQKLNEPSANGLHQPIAWELVYSVGSPLSEEALHYVESRLRAYNESHLDHEMKRLGVAAVLPATTTRRAIDYAGAPTFSLAALIPLILVLMTVTGAVYPAIDLTAGERERGTLEMLIAAPVPRLGLLLAKYVAVLTVAVLTAVVNLIGMTLTAQATGLAVVLFGEGGMSLLVVVKVLLLLGLFAAFFSAVLLALTSAARSFKEAQAYIIPLMLLCLVPGVVCLIPSLQFTMLLAVTPLVNIVLLARDLLEGSVNGSLAAAAICSTTLYVAAAIALAARIFGGDAVLYGSQASWSDLLRRPTAPQASASVPTALAALAIMFPAYFVLSGTLARSPNLPMDRRLVIGAVITAFVFGMIPWLLARYGRVSPGSGMGFRAPGIGGLTAAVLLGLVLWPLAHELFLANRWLGLTLLGEQQVASVRQMLDEWRDVSPVLILLTLAVGAGVFEELFFRGFLYSSLRSKLCATRTIVVSAILFGLFHVVAANLLAPERFLPSAFLGLVLGWVRHRTGSVIPCMALHTVHNGLLLSIAYWRDDLVAHGWGVGEYVHLPAVWLAAAALGIALAVATLIATTGRKSVAVD